MTFDPLMTAPFEIQLHVGFAAIAIFLGPIALYRQRRDLIHKISGYIWVSGIAGLAITGLFIESEFAIVGRFGPIHLFSFLALWGVIDGVRDARKGDIRSHHATMQSIWYGAMGITGLLTLLPGRTLNRVVFGEPSLWGFALIAVGGVGLGWLWLRSRRSRRGALLRRV